MKLSIVAPAFNEEEVLPFFIDRTHKACKNLEEKNIINEFEIILVDDGSKDGTWNIINSNNKLFKEVKGLKFSRNFGHHIALTAGIDYADGDYIVIMDSDLQDEPEVIESLINKCNEGYDIVQVYRKSRIESFFKKTASKYFYKLFNKISDYKVSENVGVFRLFTKNVRDNVIKLREQKRLIIALIEWTGFKTANVHVDRPERMAGKTKYSLTLMLLLAINGILSFSTFPLKLSIYIGTAFAAISLGLAVYYAFLKIFIGEVYLLGWPSLIISILLIGGLQLIALGIIGLYVGKIFEEVKSRPLYIVEITLI